MWCVARAHNFVIFFLFQNDANKLCCCAVMMMSGHFGGDTDVNIHSNWRIVIIIICLSQVFKTEIQMNACDDKWMNVWWCMHNQHVRTRTLRGERRNQTLKSITYYYWYSNNETELTLVFEASRFFRLYAVLVPVLFACLFTHNHIQNNNNKINQTKEYRFQMNSNESCRTSLNSMCDTDFSFFEERSRLYLN